MCSHYVWLDNYTFQWSRNPANHRWWCFICCCGVSWKAKTIPINHFYLTQDCYTPPPVDDIFWECNCIISTLHIPFFTGLDLYLCNKLFFKPFFFSWTLTTTIFYNLVDLLFFFFAYWLAYHASISRACLLILHHHRNPSLVYRIFGDKGVNLGGAFKRTEKPWRLPLDRSSAPLKLLSIDDGWIWQRLPQLESGSGSDDNWNHSSLFQRV